MTDRNSPAPHHLAIETEGYFHLHGSGPEDGHTWCSPVELEWTLSLHPSVFETAVVGRADDDGFLKPAAWVVLKNGISDSIALELELIEYCKSRLAPNKFPRWFHFVPELPKTATGKALRDKLRVPQEAGCA